VTYRVKVKVTGREVAWEYRFTRVRKGLRLGFTAKMVQLFALSEASVGIRWTGRWVERA
jgi:hypothetical protein